MNGATAYALSKQYVSDTADSLGSLKGAPCTIKSITEVDGGQKVTFEWTGTSGTKQTSEMTVKNGVSVIGISDKGNGKFTLLLSDGSETSAVRTIKGGKGNPGDKGEPGVDGVTPNLTIGTVETLPSGSDATATITGDKENPVLNLGIPKGADGTNGLTSTQITLLENVLYACAFTDANGKSKVDALINSLRNGTNTDTDTKPEVPPSDDTTVYNYTDIIESTFESGKFNWGIGYKLNETTGDIEEDVKWAISPLIYVSNGSTFSIDNYLVNGRHYIITYQSSTKAFKEKIVLSSPYNFIRNNKGKDYYYRICSLAADISNPTSFTRGTI